MRSLVVLLIVAVPVLADERPMIGDVAHGQSLLQQVGAETRVDGAWINSFPDAALVEKLKGGSDGLPTIESDNALDRWDALAALRAKNTDIKDVAAGASHVLVSDTKLDENAEKRLTEQAKIKASEIVGERRVFGLYKIDGEAGLSYVYDKETKKRDKLKKDTKLGYVVFVKIPGFRGGTHEAAFAVDKDVRITQVEVRAPDGSAPLELNQAAARFVGKGARGRYDELKAGGAGKAIGEIARPLSDAYLMGMESVYMFEVAERDYFAFDD